LPFVIEGNSVIDNRPLRPRDFAVGGDENRYSTAVVNVECKPNYGVVAGTQRVKDDSKEILTCKGGFWVNDFGNERSIECSVCYDAYEFEWRDEKGNTCEYYATRPMLCNENQGARERCRVSCRSCLQAEQSFKVRNTVVDLSAVPQDKRSNWIRKRKKIALSRTRTIAVTRAVEVTVELPMNEVCTNGSGTNMRKPADGCPEGFSPM